MSRSILQGETPTTERLREIIEVETDVTLWSQPHRVTPRLVEEVFGDGRRLLGIVPLATRPNYYLVRVDSSWDWRKDGVHSESVIRDHLDEIHDAIEDEYGDTICDCDDSQMQCDSECHHNRDFPALHLDCGCSWFRAEWPAEVQP